MTTISASRPPPPKISPPSPLRCPPRLRQAVEEADPALDADLTAWFADDCHLPRLTLLGPVGARTHGIAIAKRKPYYTELLAYLATRPARRHARGGR